jgi:hypothetical protein
MTHTATGGSATDQARDKAQEVGAQAKEKAQEAGAQARSRVRDEVDRRSTQAGEQAGSTAQALRDVSGRVREEGNEPIARGLEQVADRVDRAGGWLRDSDGDRILRDVEDFGRRNSLLVIAGGLAIGFAASRLLKASSRKRYESSSQLPATTSADFGNGASGRTSSPPPAVTPDSTVGATTGTVPTDPGASPRTSVPPREGLTEAGLTGGTPATSPPGWQGGLGGEGEGNRRS